MKGFLIMTNWPLMINNISKEDLNIVTSFLNQDPPPILTNSKKVLEFEKLWSDWLGVKYSVFVNSGSSANQLTMLILKYLKTKKEIILPPLNWVSDIASVLQNGFTPIFCDINLKTLSLDENEIGKKITKNTGAIFLTHILGYNGLTDKVLELSNKHDIPIIEDACESHGAIFNNKKAGSYGLISNFSFYYAHHLTTIEGGMICTNDEIIYQLARIFRSHGMLRESTDDMLKTSIQTKYKDLNKDFIFLSPAYNFRSTEINAVMGINQLKSLDKNNSIRKENLDIFLDNLDSTKFYTDFNREGNSNYAFTLLLKNKDFDLRDNIEQTLTKNSIEFRRGMSGGGNQLRQPYLKEIYNDEYKKYPNTEHVHHFGWYIGNYPDLKKDKIVELTKILNNIN